MPTKSIKLCLAASFIAVLTTGCALTSNAPTTAAQGLPLQGSVHGGQQPIVGAHVYLLAANTAGYGAASTSVINSGIGVATDSLGSYVLTDALGNFTITGDYFCTPNTQVYLYALGGNPGAGTNNSASLMAVLGNCPNTGNFLTTIPSITINEVTTIAAAYAMSGFATDSTHVSSSGTALAQIGIQNAFANAANLANVSTGIAQSKPVANNGTVPTALINSLANILSGCVNSTTNSTNCGFVFAFCRANGLSGTVPTDTATAAINMAHNPANTQAFQLIPAVGPFQPSLSSTPNDFAIAITFTGGLNLPYAIAIDSLGNAWVSNISVNPSHSYSISKFSPLGVSLSGTSGYTGGGLTGPTAIAIDTSNNVWVTNFSSGGSGIGNSLSEFSNSGTAISTSAGFSGGGLFGPYVIAMDIFNDAFVGNNGTGSSGFNLSVAQPNGTPFSPSTGFTGGGINSPGGIAIDPNGTVWVTNNNNSVTLNFTGALSSDATNSSGNGFNTPLAIAIDHQNLAWIVNQGSNSLLIATQTTRVVTHVSAATGGGLNAPLFIALDGAGNAWVTNANSPNNAISEFNNAGTALSTSTGFYGKSASGTAGIAVDGSGDVWVVNQQGSLAEFIGAATPVVTPLVSGVLNNTLASRP